MKKKLEINTVTVLVVSSIIILLGATVITFGIMLIKYKIQENGDKIKTELSQEFNKSLQEGIATLKEELHAGLKEALAEYNVVVH